MTNMTERPTDSPSGAGWPQVLLVLAPVLYLASVGPVAWIVNTHSLEMDSIPGMVISIIYWPVIFLANEVSLFGDVLTWYLELFLP